MAWLASMTPVRNDRRIEQRRGGDRVLHREIRANQQSALARKIAGRVDPEGGGVVMLFEDLFQFLVAVLEIAQHPAQNLVDFQLGKPADAVEDVAQAGRAARIELPRDHPADVALEPHGQPPDFQR